ncbi:LemA family protein [Petrocella sp. FN5]|uniref:LemA family protein n=1 Tax=Petrocella sp. FN5 TaxID=3032002 RepID=UPI0023DBC529|nr:LemA family protein [Petrocella sp. FN5]MDF1616209.1 LemA family protein [Petrocella sp. FN5]
MLYFGIGIVALLIFLGLWIILFYNKMIGNKAKVDNSWGQINVQLKMRADLIPNLLETVSAYASHEQVTLNQVTQARNMYLNAQTQDDVIKSSDMMTGMLGRLFAVSEQYPDLKANQGFLDLQNQLRELEQKIAMYRQFYNDSVLKYNQFIITIPNNIFAAIFGATEFSFFQIDSSEQSAPTVSFRR